MRHKRCCGYFRGQPSPIRLLKIGDLELDRTLDVYILRLRQKIETPDGASFLRSVRSFGYSFEPGVAQSASS